MLKKIFWALLFIALPVSACTTNAQVIDRVELIDRGIYEAEVLKDIFIDTVELSYQETKIDKRIIETSKVSSKSYLHFGFRVRILGKGDGHFPLTRRVIHPPSKSGTTVEGYTEKARVNRVYWITFDFDDQTRKNFDSLVGDWTLQMLNGDVILHEESFDVH